MVKFAGTCHFVWAPTSILRSLYTRSGAWYCGKLPQALRIRICAVLTFAHNRLLVAGETRVVSLLKAKEDELHRVRVLFSF